MEQEIVCEEENVDDFKVAENDGSKDEGTPPPVLSPFLSWIEESLSMTATIPNLKSETDLNNTSDTDIIRKERPKKLTRRRQEIIQTFLLEVQGNLAKFGRIGGEVWMNEILCRLGGPRGRYAYLTPQDVECWLATMHFAKVYEQLLELQRKKDYMTMSAPEDNPQIGESASTPTEPQQQQAPSFLHVQIQDVADYNGEQSGPQAPFSLAECEFKHCSTESNPIHEKVEPGQYLFALSTPPELISKYLDLSDLKNTTDTLRNLQQQRQQQQIPTDVYVYPEAVLVQVPPSNITQSFLIQNTSWVPYKQEDVELPKETLETATSEVVQIKIEPLKQEKE